MILLAAIVAQAIALAPAEVVSLPFAPPIDQPVIEEHVFTRELVEGGQARFVVRREYRFSRDGDGYLVVMRATGIDSDAVGAARTGFEVGSRPMIGIPLRVRLDGDGRVVSVENAEAYWAAFTAGQMALRKNLEDRTGLTPSDRRVIAAVVDGILTMPAEAREAHLRGDVAELTALAGRTLSTSVPIAFEAVGSRAGGTLSVTSVGADEVVLALSAATGEGALLARVDTSEQIVVDRATGLIRSRVRDRATRQGEHLTRSIDERRIVPL